jgi:23S rRNA pseudouridine1911/1915/1917 synthase
VTHKTFAIRPGAGAGERLDVFLSRRVPEFTRAQFQRFIDKGFVSVNGEHKKSSLKLRAGDRIEADIVIPEAGPIEPEDVPLSVLYEDEAIAVIDKPPGMVVHPGSGVRTGTLANALLHRYPPIRGVGEEDRPGIVHRLDKDTSGAIVVALTPASQLELKRQFKAREVKKIYLALVVGRPSREEGSFDWPIGRHHRDGGRMSVKSDKPRTAITEFRVLRTFGEFSLLEVRPLTGRTHQIRVHLAAAGHPVAGDRRYGSPKRSGFRFPRLFLHAHRLSFRHPSTGALLSFTSPLPGDLRAVLDSLETPADSGVR